MWLDLKGPVVADTAYKNGVLVAKDVTINLPAVTFVTHDHRAMGTVSVVVPGQIEAMEATITKVGLDEGLSRMVAPETETYEFRWAQNVVGADGCSKVEGCKAFLRMMPTSIPGQDLDPGNASEGGISFAVVRYQVFVAGEEYWLIDPLKYILRVGGKNYTDSIGSML